MHHLLIYLPASNAGTAQSTPPSLCLWSLENCVENPFLFNNIYNMGTFIFHWELPLIVLFWWHLLGHQRVLPAYTFLRCPVVVQEKIHKILCRKHWFFIWTVYLQLSMQAWRKVYLLLDSQRFYSQDEHHGLCSLYLWLGCMHERNWKKWIASDVAAAWLSITVGLHWTLFLIKWAIAVKSPSFQYHSTCIRMSLLKASVIVYF